MLSFNTCVLFGTEVILGPGVLYTYNQGYDNKEDFLNYCFLNCLKSFVKRHKSAWMQAV